VVVSGAIFQLFPLSGFYIFSSNFKKIIFLQLVLTKYFLDRNWFVKWITGASVQTINDDVDLGSDDEDDDKEKDEEKKTIKERLQAIQEVSQTVQNTIGFLASLGESVKK
jgi:hypothetical protein